MWEKLNKVSVQVIVAMICIVSINGLAYLMFFKALPSQNKEIATLMIGQLQGAIIAGVFGWLYSHSKGNTKIQ
jgi:hypothetical protein